MCSDAAQLLSIRSRSRLTVMDPKRSRWRFDGWPSGSGRYPVKTNSTNEILIRSVADPGGV